MLNAHLSVLAWSTILQILMFSQRDIKIFIHFTFQVLYFLDLELNWETERNYKQTINLKPSLHETDQRFHQIDEIAPHSEFPPN